MSGAEDRNEEPPTAEVIRSVTVDAPVAAVWDVVADPDQRDRWLDDDDALSRETRLDRVDPHRGLSWTWWRPGDGSSAAEVEIALFEVEPAKTQVVVIERPVQPTAAQMPTAQASATGGGIWGYRLLGLELLLMAAVACVR